MRTINPCTRSLFLLPVLLLTLAACSFQSALAQGTTERKPVYRLSSGTEITKAQVDSLALIYGDKLTYQTRMTGDGIQVTVLIPGEVNPEIGGFTVETTDSGRVYRRDQQPADSSAETTSFDTGGGGSSDLDSMAKRYLGLDGETEIDGETFQALMATQQYQMRYAIDMQARVITYSLILLEEYRETRSKLHTDFMNRWIGQPFPDISVPLLEGNPATMQQWKGKITVLNFWFIRCRPCLNEMSDLNELVRQYESDPEVQFIAPALDSAEELGQFQDGSHPIFNSLSEAMRQNLLENYDRPFLYRAAHSSAELAELLGLPAYPVHMVVDRDGNFRYIEIGAIENVAGKLADHIRTLLEDH